MKQMTRIRGVHYFDFTVRFGSRFLLCKHRKVSNLVLEYPFLTVQMKVPLASFHALPRLRSSLQDSGSSIETHDLDNNKRK